MATGPISSEANSPGRCTVSGCGCRDPRVLSRRHAAFVSSRAKASGETADRVIAVEAEWRLPLAGLALVAAVEPVAVAPSDKDVVA
jgi:hypothetical protein